MFFFSKNKKKNKRSVFLWKRSTGIWSINHFILIFAFFSPFPIQKVKSWFTFSLLGLSLIENDKNQKRRIPADHLKQYFYANTNCRYRRKEKEWRSRIRNVVKAKKKFRSFGETENKQRYTDKRAYRWNTAFSSTWCFCPGFYLHLFFFIFPHFELIFRTYTPITGCWFTISHSHSGDNIK